MRDGRSRSQGKGSFSKYCEDSAGGLRRASIKARTNNRVARVRGRGSRKGANVLRKDNQQQMAAKPVKRKKKLIEEDL